jgi:hypothetical protein
MNTNGQFAHQFWQMTENGRFYRVIINISGLFLHRLSSESVALNDNNALILQEKYFEIYSLFRIYDY